MRTRSNTIPGVSMVSPKKISQERTRGFVDDTIDLSPSLPQAFLKALGGSGAASDAKSRKVERLLERANEAMRKVQPGKAEPLFDEAMALMGEVPNTIWLARLTAAAKAENFGFVADHYDRLRGELKTQNELARLDSIWVETLNSTGLVERAVSVARKWRGVPSAHTGDILSGMGNALMHLERFDEALDAYEAVLRQNPEHATARWNLALAQLRLGHVPDGFHNYEARWSLSWFPSEKRVFDIPRWEGEPIESKSVLVWREQGVGDEIRFASLLADLNDAGAKVTFECSPKLVELFRDSFPYATVRRVGPLDCRTEASYGEFDYQIPVGSLPRFLRPTVGHFEEACRPWLRQYPGQRVREMMGADEADIVVGLCWRSSRRSLTRNKQYVAADAFAALQLLGGVRVLCLQYDECADECERLQQLGLPIVRFADVNQKDDLVSAAHMMSACDMVVSAGTAVAEMTAGLGIPTVMFGSSRTQIQLGTDRIPWHPCTRYLPMEKEDVASVARRLVLNWQDYLDWAAANARSGRATDWRTRFRT